MKLLKKILAVFTFLFVFTVMAVNMGVNAASYSHGTVNVTTTTNTNDTKTWTFTGAPTKNDYANGDDINGVILFKGNNKVATSSSDGLRLYTDKDTKGATGGSYVYVPVPENTTGGSLTVIWTSNNSSRGLYIYNTGSTSTDTYILSKLDTGNTVTFDSDDILSDATYGNYLKLYSVATDGTSKENKVGTIKVTVTGAAYEAMAADVNVGIYDGETKLITKTVKEGDKLTFTPKKIGYTFVGYYTNAGLTDVFDYVNTTISSSNTSLYAKFTQKNDNPVDNNNENSLSNQVVSYAYDALGTSDIEYDTTVNFTNYTILNKCKMQTSNNVKCIGTASAVSTSSYGVKFVVSEESTITVKITTAGSSARNAKLINNSGNEINIVSGNKSWTDAQANVYEVRTLQYTVSAGTYIMGGTNGMRIFEIYVSPVSITTGTSTGVSTVDGTKAVRFIGSLVKEGITASDITSVSATISISGSEKAATVKNVTNTVDTSIGTLAPAAENTLYFYTSVYGFENTDYDTRVLTVVFNVTFADNTAVARTVTYTIDYASMAV